jgi:sugar/nucleoside kinase (ribokinase family)
MRHVHVSHYFLQQALQPGLPALLAEVQAAGATVSLDSNWDPAEAWNHGLARALAQTDVFLPNEQEALAIAQAAELDTALERLTVTIPLVTVKRGAQGAMARQGATVVSDPGFRVEAVDTTGAGDTFDAGFLYGYLHGWPLADSLALGCACGALSTQAAGGTTAQPTLVEAQGLIQQRESLR